MSEWQEQARCSGRELDDFFTDYEQQPEIRYEIDEMCLHCPVKRECLSYGKSMKADGVWGGYYLVNGEADQKKNDHKDEKLWPLLKRA